MEYLRPSEWLWIESPKAGEALDVAAASVAMVLLADVALDLVGIESLRGWFEALPSLRVTSSPLIVVYVGFFFLSVVWSPLVTAAGMALVESVLFWAFLCMIGWSKMLVTSWTTGR